MLIIYCDQKGTLHRVLGKGFTVLPSGVGAVAVGGVTARPRLQQQAHWEEEKKKKARKNDIRKKGLLRIYFHLVPKHQREISHSEKS